MGIFYIDGWRWNWHQQFMAKNYVMGFMGMSEECRTCQGMWQIYGDPISSLGLMKRMEAAKSQVADWMTEGHAVADVLCGACFKIA